MVLIPLMAISTREKSIFCRKNIVVAVYTVRMLVFVISCVVVLVCLNLFVDVILNAYDLV